MATDPIRDPVHRATYVFHPEGEDLIVETWLEKGGVLPPHLHPRQVERWSVVEGKVRFQLGDDKRVIGPEDGELLVEPGTKHALWGITEEPAHLRCHVSPANELQAFLHDSALAAQEGMFIRGGIPKSLRGARWAARFIERHREDTVLMFPPRFAQSAMISLLARH